MTVHLLRPLNCNPLQEMCPTRSTPRPLLSHFHQQSFSVPLKHMESNLHTVQSVAPVDFQLQTNYVCLSENNLNPITFVLDCKKKKIIMLKIDFPFLLRTCLFGVTQRLMSSVYCYHLLSSDFFLYSMCQREGST